MLDQNEENLKALTNEWIMPKVEEQLTGVAKEGFDPRNGGLPDFYGRDALAELTKKGLPSEIPFEQAKKLAQTKSVSSRYSRCSTQNGGESLEHPEEWYLIIQAHVHEVAVELN